MAESGCAVCGCMVVCVCACGKGLCGVHHPFDQHEHKMADDKFPARIVLGEGHPWALGVERYKEVCLNKEPIGVEKVTLDFPEVLWSKEVPRYRLVLERVQE